MNTSTAIGFTVRALPTETLDQVRATNLDSFGQPVVDVTATGGGEPLRCCLRDARPGEKLILFGYQPPVADGPYREIGPVFAHRDVCSGPDGDAYPSTWRGRPQVLRAYDDRGWIHPSTQTHDGTDPEGVIAAMLADPAVVQIHSRNVAYGCFMFTVHRAD